MPNKIRVLAVVIALLPAPAFAQRATPAFPIMGDDGRPVANHRIAPELKGAAEKLPGAVVAGNTGN